MQFLRQRVLRSTEALSPKCNLGIHCQMGKKDQKNIWKATEVNSILKQTL